MAAIVFSACMIARANDQVKFTLNWVPEPEFGGVYAAHETGEFANRQLDVTIQPGGAGTPTWQLVATGKSDYGIASADEVLIAQSQGADVVAIFATYQVCPQGLMAHASRGFKELSDVFKNSGTVAMEPGLPYVSFLKKKYGFEKVKVVAYDGGLASFMNDKNFTQQCFVFSEPISAAKAGADPQVFLVAEAGYNPYTAVVITTGQRVRENRGQVDRMIAALQAGWREYLGDPLPTNRVLARLNPNMSLEAMGLAAEAQRRLIETEETRKLGLGAMTLDRWETLTKQLTELGVLSKLPQVKSCFIPSP